MKPFEELTDAEILALTEAKIEAYIDLEAADAGIPFLPKDPPTAPSKEAISDDVTVHVIEGIHFGDQAEAQRVADLLNELKTRGRNEYVGRHYTRRRFVPQPEHVHVTQVTMLSDARAGSMGAAIATFEEEKRQYDDARREYDDIERQRESIAERVHKRLSSARRKHERQQELGRQFERHIELADGNRAIAARFLAKAHSDARELRPDLFAEADAAGLETPSKAAPVQLTDDIPI